LPERMPDGREWPKISIVTPSFNQGQYLEETIRSVLLQGYPNLQYIVMDGGSTDDSPAIIQRYSAWLDRFKIARDGGQTDALNQGFATSDGLLLTFLNSDDLLEKGALARVAEACVVGTKGSISMCVLAGYVQHFSESGNGALGMNESFGAFGAWVDGSAAIHQPGTFWTYDLWQEAGPFPLSMHYAFDRFFFAAIAAFEPTFIHLPNGIARFRVHSESKSVTAQQMFAREWKKNVPDLLRRAPRRAIARAGKAIRDWRALDVAGSLLSDRSALSGAVSALSAVISHPSILRSRPFWGAMRLFLGAKRSRDESKI
jgi:glycosyltransferase involved in cell wall biosynthesis